MARRKLRRRPRWLTRKPGYKHLHALHAYEEQVVLAELRKRGSGNAVEWARRDPDRWDPVYLQKAFKRLRDKRLIKRTGWRDHFTRRYTYYPPAQPEEEAA